MFWVRDHTESSWDVFTLNEPELEKFLLGDSDIANYRVPFDQFEYTVLYQIFIVTFQYHSNL